MWFLLIILSGTGFFFILLYNRLIRDKNMVMEAWAGIDVQLKRRHDLIPKLISTVAGYMGYEKTLLENITRLREENFRLEGKPERAQKEAELSENLGRLFALVENYPELKANNSFLALQSEISKVEDTLQLARRYYNGSVRNFNVRIASFPSLLVARLFKFAPASFFEAESEEREVPGENPA